LFFTSFFLVPVLKSSPAVAGQVMADLQKRRLFTLLPIAALLTIASGLRLLAIASGGFSGSYFSTAPGRTYATAGIATSIAFLLSVLISRPGFLRIGRLGASLPAAPDDAARQLISAEIQRLTRRVTISNGLVVVLLLSAAAGMAIARYL
jgi:hypothetical protein